MLLSSSRLISLNVCPRSMSSSVCILCTSVASFVAKMPAWSPASYLHMNVVKMNVMGKYMIVTKRAVDGS